METSFDAPINEKIEVVQVPGLNSDANDYNLLKNKPGIPTTDIVNFACTLNEFGGVYPALGFKTYSHSLGRVPTNATAFGVFVISGSVFHSSGFWDGADYSFITSGSESSGNPLCFTATGDFLDLYMRGSNNLIRISSATDTDITIRFYLEGYLGAYIGGDLKGTILIQ